MRPMQLGRLFMLIVCMGAMLSCSSGPKERKVEFVYLALGASDAAGVGALPLTEGYVYLVNRELSQRQPGVFLMNLGVPGARIDLIKEQVRVAEQLGTKANLVTLWTGANDLIKGDNPNTFQEDLRALLRMVKDSISKKIVVANLPNLTQIPRYRQTPDPSVTLDRVKAFNKAIESEVESVGAELVDLFAEPVRDALIFDLDGFHPNDAGHRELARLFLREIIPLLGL